MDSRFEAQFEMEKEEEKFEKIEAALYYASRCTKSIEYMQKARAKSLPEYGAAKEKVLRLARQMRDRMNEADTLFRHSTWNHLNFALEAYSDGGLFKGLSDAAEAFKFVARRIEDDARRAEMNSQAKARCYEEAMSH